MDQLKAGDSVKVKSMQRLGNEAIRTKIQPSKPKRELKLQIVKIQREHKVKQVSSSFQKVATQQPKPN